MRYPSRVIPVLCLMAAICVAQNYTAERISQYGVVMVRLKDLAGAVEVTVAPSLGNRAVQVKVHGQDILYHPPLDSPDSSKKPRLGGVPFLAPWADLLDEQAFYANGKRYQFNMGLGNPARSPWEHGSPITYSGR
jgi:aldose 1-epimerase